MDMETWGPGGILALDLASITGVAYGPIEAVIPAFGRWHLPMIGGEGARYAAFENELADAMDTLCPSKLILEKGLPLPALNNVRSANQQFALRGIAYAEAWRASCPVFEIDTGTVRSALLGARYSRDIVKREVVKYCFRRGIRVPDHNAGDAVMVWLWHQAQIRRIPRVAGPLFAAAD